MYNSYRRRCSLLYCSAACKRPRPEYKGRQGRNEKRKKNPMP
jgi:hypothetical protein